MTKIHLLDLQTANSIAAGEVIERPSSVVKELLENALDAGSSVISAEISQGGIQLIRVTDNGSGMDEEDARLAFSRHATSKLTTISDLDTLMTMGFRGEALASIAAVARVTLETRQGGHDTGYRIVIEGGECQEQTVTGCPEGTRISVENLFYNVPARFKFLRKDSTEAGHVIELVERMALARPDVSFRLINNGQEALHTPGNNDQLSAVYAVFGRQTAANCLALAAQDGALAISGFAGNPESARNNRTQQCFYVNGRLIRSRTLTAAVDEAYNTRLMKGKYATVILFLTVPAQLIDVNVHPQKLEVRFWNDSEVFRSVYHAIRSALGDGSAIIAPDDTDEEADETIREQESKDQQATEAKDQQARTDSVPPVPPVRAKPEASAWHQAGLPLCDQAINPAVSYLDSTGETSPVTTGAQPAVDGRLTVKDLSRARLIGSLFRTYILLEAGDALLLIDQHAAHEKIIFERLVARHRQVCAGGAPLIQDLLVPVVIEIGRRDVQTLQEQSEQLQKLGFDCSLLGATTVAIRSIPDTGDHQLDPGPALLTVLAGLQQDRLKADDAILDVFYQMSCKAAVKAHDHLDEAEIRQLLDDLRQLEDPYHCPHGRPVIIQLSRRDLEKHFRRIV